MHERWCASGYDPDAFWGQTPRSFQSAMQGAMERLRREGESDLAHAHTSARFQHADPKKLKPLDYYLRRRDGRKGGGSLLDRVKAIADRTAAR